MQRRDWIFLALVGAGIVIGNAPVGAQSAASKDRSPSALSLHPKATGKTKASGKGAGKTRKPSKPAPAAHLVAYDSHDRRYYSLQWAKENGMRDPGGDPLVILPLEKLPKGTNPAVAPSSRRFATPSLFSAPSRH
jgi:hypothetical protein